MLTVSQASSMLGVSDARVRILAANGSLAAVKLGRQWQIYEWSVKERLSRNVKPGRPKTGGAQKEVDPKIALAHELYQQCEMVFSKATNPSFLMNIDDEKERNFAVCLANYFMACKQKELIDQEARGKK